MAVFDQRTKPSNEWTYYVVDDLPTMKNLYRYDTVEQAIDKFKEIPDNLSPALGSSIQDRYEIDHIHRRLDCPPVLIRDCDHPNCTPIWRESKELQNAIDQMIAYLNVQYELNSTIFGLNYPSVAVELERYANTLQDTYFTTKLLCPDDPQKPLSCISEVFVEGQGWMTLEPFLHQLDNNRLQYPGDHIRDIQVGRLNIKYLSEFGEYGEADISTRQFEILRDRTQFLLNPEQLATDLDSFCADFDPYEYQDQVTDRADHVAQLKDQLSAGSSLYDFRKYLSDIVEENEAPLDILNRAKSLHARLSVLTPKEFRQLERRKSLSVQMKYASRTTKQQAVRPSLPDRGEER